MDGVSSQPTAPSDLDLEITDSMFRQAVLGLCCPAEDEGEDFDPTDSEELECGKVFEITEVDEEVTIAQLTDDNQDPSKINIPLFGFDNKDPNRDFNRDREILCNVLVGHFRHMVDELINRPEGLFYACERANGPRRFIKVVLREAA